MSCPGCTRVLAHHHLTSPHTSQRQRQRQHQHHVVVCFCSSSPPFPPPSRFTVRFTQDPHVTHMSIALRRSQPSLPRFQPTLQCMLHKLSPPLAFRCGAECEDTPVPILEDTAHPVPDPASISCLHRMVNISYLS